MNKKPWKQIYGSIKLNKKRGQKSWTKSTNAKE